jgi:hypothetical protein
MAKIYLALQVKTIERITQATYLTLDHDTFKNKLAHMIQTYNYATCKNFFDFPYHRTFCDELKKMDLGNCGSEPADSYIYDFIYYEDPRDYKKMIQDCAKKIQILLDKQKQMLESASDEDRTKIIKNIE